MWWSSTARHRTGCGVCPVLCTWRTWGWENGVDNIQSACPLILKTQGVTFSVSFASTSTCSLLYIPRFLSLEKLISVLLGVYLCFCGYQEPKNGLRHYKSCLIFTAMVQSLHTQLHCFNTNVSESSEDWGGGSVVKNTLLFFWRTSVQFPAPARGILTICSQGIYTLFWSPQSLISTWHTERYLLTKHS